MVTPAARREAVAYLRVTYEVSERRACSALRADRTSVRFRSIRCGWSPSGTVSASKIYTWLRHFGGFGANGVKRLKAARGPEPRLKKLVAELDLRSR
jgi:putative transposase